MNKTYLSETIAAIATPPGRGGVGIVRISGKQLAPLAKKIMGYVPEPRKAIFSNFKDIDGKIIDQGICLFFTQPNSFTGEDVLELQGHGGPVILDTLLQNLISMGVRLALPGEFTQRAFLNNKIDLIQAEAVADLIDAGSKQAARSAVRSLQGDFSNQVNKLVASVIELRMFIEAAIDFPEEEIDFISLSKVNEKIADLISQLDNILRNARQGVLLQEGMTLVLIGKPNVGKSSLLNYLSGRDSAIVTDIAGTTRDILREHIHLDGLPLHIIDTAGLRESEDVIEKEGIRRTKQAIKQADAILLLIEATDSTNFNKDMLLKELKIELQKDLPIIIVRNKIDLIHKSEQQPNYKNKNLSFNSEEIILDISAKYGHGIDNLIHYLKQKMGYEHHPDGIYMARRRHLTALAKTLQYLLDGKEQLKHAAFELLAEELSLAQQALAEITGEFCADDLLGKIFSTFCIGK